MTTYGLTPLGFFPKTLPIIVAETESALRAVFGASVPLGAKTLLGILNGIYSEREALVWEVAEQVYNAQDPNGATGQSLVAIGAITGTLPLLASSSIATVTLTGTPATLVAAGTLVSTASTSADFATNVDATITLLTSWSAASFVVGDRVTNANRCYQCITAGNSIAAGPTTTSLDYTDGGGVHWRYLGEGIGAIDVKASSVDKGPITAAAGDLTVKKTPIGGWLTAVNVADAVKGTLVETDEDFRIRRALELSLDGSTTQDALRASLLTLTGVSTVTVFMNVTDVTDAFGTPPHSVQAVVQGGQDQDIIDLLRASIGAGIGTYGNTSGTSTDSQGNVYAIAFTRPAPVTIYVDITLKYNPAIPAQGGYPVDGDAEVIAAIVAYGNAMGIGANAVATAIGAQAFKVPGVLDIPRSGSLGGTLIKTSATPTADTTIVITPLQVATFDPLHVTVHSTVGTV